MLNICMFIEQFWGHMRSRTKSSLSMINPIVMIYLSPKIYRVDVLICTRPISCRFGLQTLVNCISSYVCGLHQRQIKWSKLTFLKWSEDIKKQHAIIIIWWYLKGPDLRNSEWRHLDLKSTTNHQEMNNNHTSLLDLITTLNIYR